MAQVLALVDDIFFGAKLRETAKQLGVELRIFSTPSALFDAHLKESPLLVIVDLNGQNAPLETIKRLCSATPRPRVISFLSHVQVELAEKARAAGCEVVMPRSRFTRDLATILMEVKSQSA